MSKRALRRILWAVCVLGLLALIVVQGCVFFNRSPIARITLSAFSGESPLQVAFDAGSSSDPDGAITRYAWDFGDGGTATTETANHVFVAVTETKTFKVTLTVFDDDGAEGRATQSIEVRPQGTGDAIAGDAPVARLRADRLVGVAPVTVMFDASASTGGAGPITSYNWDFGDGTTLIGSAVVSHVFQPAETETYLVTLRVWNELDLNHAGQVEIVAIVPDAVGGGDAPIAELTANDPLLLFESNSLPAIPSIFEVIFDPRGSSADAGQRIDYYEWNFGDGTLALKKSNATETHVYELSAETRTFLVTLTVYDDQGYSDVALLNITLTQP
jgi:PKD repeat protein